MWQVWQVAMVNSSASSTSSSPGWLDLPLRRLEYLLLGFFVWAVWIAMDRQAVAAFLSGPYARVVDARM